MSDTLFIDQRGFFLQGKPYTPVISRAPKEAEVRAVSLDLGVAADLSWEEVKKKSGEKIFWQLNFGLEKTPFPWYSLAILRSFHRAIDHFIEIYLTNFREETLAICLYDGPLYPLNTREEEEEEIVEKLSTYLQYLAAPFPEEIPLFACFEVSSTSSPTLLAQRLSLKNFPYFHLGLKESMYPIGVLRNNGGKWFGLHLGEAKLGIVIPNKETSSSAICHQIDTLLFQLKKRETAYRLLIESHLSEEWEGIDHLIVFSKALSIQGKRKIQGFLLAGGKLIVAGKSLGFSEEMALEKYLRSIGIEEWESSFALFDSKIP